MTTQQTVLAACGCRWTLRTKEIKERHRCAVLQQAFRDSQLPARGSAAADTFDWDAWSDAYKLVNSHYAAVRAECDDGSPLEDDTCPH